MLVEKVSLNFRYLFQRLSVFLYFSDCHDKIVGTAIMRNIVDNR